MIIRTLRSDEADLHRRIRLRALRDSPDSFGVTAGDAERSQMSFWDDQTRAVTEPGRNAMFLTCDGAGDDEKIHGMIYALRDPDRPDGGRIGGMWVEPAMRRQGLGRNLLTAAVDWARALDMTQLGLWAPAHSEAAMEFYRHMGFRENGRRGGLRGGSPLEIVEMTRGV